LLYLQIESILIQISINLFVVVTNASTTTVTVTEVPVMSPKDFEDACKQPVIIGTVVSMAAMVPVNFIGMFAMFSKLEKMFNPHRLMAIQRQKKLLRGMSKKK
jgi:hypothetical protein